MKISKEKLRNMLYNIEAMDESPDVVFGYLCSIFDYYEGTINGMKQEIAQLRQKLEKIGEFGHK